MKIAIGCDHAAFTFKEEIKAYLTAKGHELVDKGCYSAERSDYPDYGIAVGEAVARGEVERGIVICGSGIGISIAANKVKGVRCALCLDVNMAHLSRQHNDANVLAMGARLIDVEMGKAIVDEWLQAEFEGGRHCGRIDKISHYESR
ncbi:MAG: ribose 5-phosphate isomerase B [Tidjanibacter sp.]|nr:ribose 5-phosphate isomerase B [Tidjanibacter sp.]MBR3682015.1 ribose 5-phosphate isomerase B [Tidjanibacter sp.]MBR3853113.1 ribose 5-phosphate isomerase B [Tidjanibacter sp.]